MTSVANTDVQQAPRSTFVTVVAWIFIILGACATLASAAQSLLFRSLSLQNRFGDMDMGTEPALLRSVFGHLEILMLLRLILVILLLIGAIALLNRREWGRKLFMTMMVVGIVCSIVFIFISQSIVSVASTHLIESAQQTGDSTMVSSILMTTRIFATVTPALVAAVLAWITYMLSRPRIKAEFDGSAA